MAKRIVLLAFVLIPVLIAVLVSSPSSPISLTPKASTGVFLTGCAYDSDGKVLGCSYSEKAPLGQSILTGFGGSVDSIKIASAYLKVNYTGQATSWAFTATELIQYDKGVSVTYPIAVRGDGNPSKVMNLTLPKSAWASSDLQSKFTGYGQKLVNASITNCSWSFIFANSIRLVKPCAYNYFVQFKINYGQDITTTTTTTTTTTSPTITQTTTITQSSTTTISGEGISSGTTDAWATTVTSASSGSGSLSQTGIILDCQPYAVQSGYTLCFVYIPPNYALPSCASGSCGQVTIVNRYISVGAFGLALSPGRWTQSNIPIGTSAGDLVLAQVFQSNSLIYSQATTISPPTTTVSTGLAQVPVAPYTDSYLAQINQSTLSGGELEVKCYSQNGTPIYSSAKCVQLSIVSVTF